MKAVIYSKYGSYDQLKLVDIEKPSPKEDEVRIKVAATSLNISDVLSLQGKPYLVRFFQGLFKPKFPILGGDVAGTVEAIGAKISGFKIGDKVFGDLSDAGRGAMAEYVCVKEHLIAIAPTTVGLVEAAAAPLACFTALQAIRDYGKLKEGEEILINGASGSVGNFAIQISKSYGANVTAVCSTKHIERAKELGADLVIDYKKMSFVNDDKTYDVILGVNGYQRLSEYRDCLKDHGRYVMIGGTGKQLFEGMALAGFASKGSKKLMPMGMAKQSNKDLLYIKSLYEEGKLKSPIDKKFPLTQSKEAFKYEMEGHPSGKVIIEVLK